MIDFIQRCINKMKSPYNRMINRNYIKRIIDNPSIYEIEIETVNRCNGVCPFCPVNAKEPQRPYAKMSTDLFYKIIADLVAIDYSGMLSIFSNNEPFLDERILDFYRYAKTHLPKAATSIFTNGSLLTDYSGVL